MVDWQSSAELVADSAAFIKFMHALLGLYAWEWATSLDFDWAVLSGKKQFRWPLIFYFAGRYLLLFALIGIAIALDTPKEINCQALYTFIQLAGDGAVGIASINLSLRTIAVWSQNRYIVSILVLIMLGHWSLILQGVLLTAAWIPGSGCAIVKSNNTVLAATFIYSMCFDLVVLCLSTYKLAWTPMKSGSGARSKLIRMIFSDGLIYFFIAFVANLIATVFMILNLNAIMSVIFNVPAAVASTIVASRVVRRLTNFKITGAEVFASSGQNSGIAFRSMNGGRPIGTVGSATKVQGAVHVEMETFTRTEEIEAAYVRPKRQTTLFDANNTTPRVELDDEDFKEKNWDCSSQEDDIKRPDVL
ncbi:hypothetical protein SERLA73DRAFT_130089 [Serpula lacrymans var. lacrymans S7.3]|uniref:Transmembrane protein n=2 Tax=Serpula lacrymans var. lacrymans TaxID=341189 RepID=F8PIP2_SERL3|nr:uncharacterized protein SERLADRAFT_378530 [Serpula lacrymans var. lacrymans S7.9]EGO03675.1 hypothetical protein SERLA73DRAFT_130089 [Serpula lacrymans var. lacrymans S7.3]EGO29538.1 hypothetical protein SERLADRAFT_378530 [Serpula lacrymans var. lacrymans S7.9]